MVYHFVFKYDVSNFTILRVLYAINMKNCSTTWRILIMGFSMSQAFMIIQLIRLDIEILICWYWQISILCLTESEVGMIAIKYCHKKGTETRQFPVPWLVRFEANHIFIGWWLFDKTLWPEMHRTHAEKKTWIFGNRMVDTNMDIY